MTITVVSHEADLEQLRVELQKFEGLYGVPSERMAAAFTDDQGTFRETRDWADWHALYFMVRTWARSRAGD
jgi:hypothetical protein